MEILPASDQPNLAQETKDLIHKIHIAVHSGSLDRKSVDEALHRLTELHVNEPAPPAEQTESEAQATH